MKTHTRSEALIPYLVFAWLFFLPLMQAVSIGAMILLGIIWIAEGRYEKSLKAWKANKVWYLFMSFYALHVLSLAWTENFKYAAFDLQVKFSLLLCPIILSGFVFSGKSFSGFRLAFISGLAVAVLICFGRAVYCLATSGSAEYFFYEKFSVFLHPTYFSFYLSLSVLFVMYELFWERRQGNFRIFLYIFLFLQAAAILLLSARTSMAVAVAASGSLILIMAWKKKLARADIIPILVTLAVAVATEAIVLKQFNRFTQVSDAVMQEEGSAVPEEENSTTIRMHLWKYAAEVIAEHPASGVGIGDIKEKLVEKYTENNYEYGIRNRISPHSQYLHTGVVLGIPGMILILLMLGAPAVLAWRKEEWLYVLFLVIIALNSVTESILERQAGILFFAFFNSLFAAKIFREKSEG